MNNITIHPATPVQSTLIAALIGELLDKIMQRTRQASFDFDLAATENKANELLTDGKYWAFLAQDAGSQQAVGVITLYDRIDRGFTTDDRRLLLLWRVANRHRDRAIIGSLEIVDLAPCSGRCLGGRPPLDDFQAVEPHRSRSRLRRSQAHCDQSGVGIGRGLGHVDPQFVPVPIVDE